MKKHMLALIPISCLLLPIDFRIKESMETRLAEFQTGFGERPQRSMWSIDPTLCHTDECVCTRPPLSWSGADTWSLPIRDHDESDRVSRHP
jgi:hypothetical protein